MKIRVLKKWIDALQGGEYKQRYGNLGGIDFDGNNGILEETFCGFGVLTDLYIKEKNLVWDKSQKGTYWFSGLSNQPPRKVLDWIGIKNEDIVDKIISLNDGDKYSFKKLGNYLKNQMKDKKSLLYKRAK